MVQEYTTIAAVDLGSNSFRLQIARIADDQIYPLDSLREPVRLGAGLNAEKYLDDASQQRAINCLRRFNERLRGLPREAVRVVGTNTFRVAKNTRAFLRDAEAALGFPIEIIAGREEARLIYLGVSHSLPASDAARLVVDIGGGSTECIIGTGFKPHKMESLYMGCVSFSRRFFPDGKLGKNALQQAELAARAELQTIAAEFSAPSWQHAVGSSGTARALAEIIEQNGFSESGITRAGLSKLRSALLKAGNVQSLQLAGLQPDRLPVLAGGFAIMSAVFDELGIEHMAIASSALREGVLYDLLGRFHHHDMREATVGHFMRRYRVDAAQAARVTGLADALFDQIAASMHEESESARQHLAWAATLHEIGISIAHSGYHKHSAYILENADMPGFSKMEQTHLSLLARAHRGSLAKVQALAPGGMDWLQIVALRLGALFCRSRTDFELPQLQLRWRNNGYVLVVDEAWLKQNPLTETLLHIEANEWKAVGIGFTLQSL